MRSSHRLAVTLGALGLLAATIVAVPAFADRPGPSSPATVAKLDASSPASPSASTSGSASPSASTSDSASASATTSSSGTASGSGTEETGPLSQTKTLTRDYFGTGGDPVDSTNTVTVKIDRNTNIQANERIHITWSGAHPTGGRTTNPFGEGGMDQEYPVMIMECRGDAQTVTPQTCWTDDSGERTISTTADPAGDNAVWLDDKYNTDADDQRVSGLTTDEAANIPDGDCQYDSTQAVHITPFVTASGTVYYGCGDSDMPPEAASASTTTPPNEIAAFTDSTGKGTDEFEVRTDTENASLGCNDTVQCSVVVVPIEGISCSSATQQQCNLTGNYQPGQLNHGVGADLAVSPRLWWSPSNWRNRFVFPIQLAPPPSVCSISSTSGNPVPFYGSELLSQAALQWTPAYCLDPKRFNWQDNVMSDAAAFQLMQQGQAVAAEVSDRGEDDTNVGYAPTAVSGWGIAFDVDKPDGTQQMTLRLDPRLLAKLLTESYPGSTLGAARPGLEHNPYSINLDPEFEKLNPGLDERNFSEAASTLLAISTSSDVMAELTSYIASNKAAMAWIDGKPDPWGMKVNPAYRGIELPVSTWPLLDSWYPKTSGSACLNENPAPYLQKIASPLSSLRLISEAMLYNWPNVNTVCNFDSSTGLYTLGRVAQQGIGDRFMLGLVDLGDAQRYGLTVASLEAAPGHYVAPTTAGLTAALQLAKPAGPQKPYALSEDAISRSTDAYPGTMVVYTAAKTKGLDAASAKDVSRFIQISSTEGQQAGRGNGQLPAGYLPIRDSGVTKPLYQQAQVVSQAVADQSGTPDSGSGGSQTGPTGGGGGAVPPNDGGTVATTPVGTISGDPSPSSSPSEPTVTAPLAKTAAISSSVSGGLLPVLLFVGVAAALMTVISRLVLRLRGVK